MRTLAVLIPAFLLITAVPPSLQSQQVGFITGQVVSTRTGIPVASAQVFIAALNVGALSSANGRYLLQNVPAGTHTLTIELIGYRAVTAQVMVTAGGAVAQDFRLTEEALGLDEIIVTGTPGGTQRRALGNAVERVDLPALVLQAPVITVQEALSGRIPGVMMIQDAGSPGHGAQIRIRGSASLGLSGDPLIYVDGIRIANDRRAIARGWARSTLDDINPKDIESIEIIKGPAASTLYGTEASNGVIQIITKRGVTGAPVFDVSVEFGQTWMAQRHLESLTNYYPDPEKCPAVPCASVDQLIAFNVLDRHQEIRNTLSPEAQLARDDIFQRGLTQRYNIGVRGGSDLIRYSASLNRRDQGGVVNWSWDERNSAGLSLDLTASEDFNIAFTGRYFEGENSSPGGGFYGNMARGGRPASVLDTGPNSLQGFRSAPESTDARFGLRTQTTQLKRSQWSLTLNYQPTDWLAFRATTGTDVSYDRLEGFTKRVGAEALFFGSCGRIGCKNVTQIETPLRTLDGSTTATFGFMDDVLGSATSFGFQYYSTETRQTILSGRNFPVSSLNSVGAAAITTGTESFVENKTVGMYVQEQIDWDDRIFVTGALRADDNSAFGTEFDVAIYPKVSATWVLHEEDFWGIDWLSQFRVRGAWGEAGQQPDAFAATRLYRVETGPGGEPVVTPSSFGNPDLGPETGQELEVGFDAELVNGKVALNFTYFNRKTKDAIIPRPLPPSLWPGPDIDYSRPTQFVNIGQVSSWGTETALNVQMLETPTVRWDINVAFSTLGNRIDDMGGSPPIVMGRTRAHVEGFPFAAIWDRKIVSAEFVSGDRGATTNVLCDGGTGRGGREPGGTPVPCGDAPFLVGDNTEPSWLANVQSTVTLFNDLRLSASLDGRGGHSLSWDFIGGRHYSYRSSQLYWLQDDPIQAAYLTVSRNALSVAKAGFVKLREVALSYDLPEALAQQVGATRATVRVGARNLVELWKAQEFIEREKVLDSEISAMRTLVDTHGQLDNGWPALSRWSFEMSMTF